MTQRWRHKKTGGTYTEVGRGRMQIANPLDMAEVVIYRSDANASLWVRLVSEFMDGRFEPIEDQTYDPLTGRFRT